MYVGQQSDARVLLLFGNGGAEYRGFFRILTEAHIPFAVSTDLDWLTDGRRDAYDLVIVPDGMPNALNAWVEEGGHLLVAGTVAPAAAADDVVAVHEATRAAWRIHDRRMFPSLTTTELVILDSPYAELKADNMSPITLIPPAMTGPPELVWLDKVETETPGLWSADVGRGRITWIPWNPGGSYHRYSSPGHAGFVVDLIDRMLPSGRQLRTNAHPLVEITVMHQPEKERTLVHLVNVSGHSGTGYFSPLATGPIEIDLAGEFSSGRAARADAALMLRTASGRTLLQISSLQDYEVIVLE
jgi:hypothetical protein